MRTGRLPAQRLGVGTIVNSALTAGRRILYWATTTSATGAILDIADTTTYMSTIYAAFAMGYSIANATGSIGQVRCSNITGGSAEFKSDDATTKHAIRYSVLLVGSPDATYIVD